MKGSIKSFNNEYIIEPFTIDNRKVRSFDDGFSVSKDQDDNISLNIHISFISFEYLKNNLKVGDLKRQITSLKIKDYVGPEKMEEYSLRVGTKKVLTLKIKQCYERYNLYSVVCEKIPITKNTCYEDENKEFYYYINKITNNFNLDDNYRIVSGMMGIYSTLLSKYLFQKSIEYIVNNRFCSSGLYRRGSFTSPLRERESFLNQFIFANEVFKNDISDELILFNESITKKNNNLSRILVPGSKRNK